MVEEFARPGVVHADHKPDWPPDVVVDAQSTWKFSYTHTVTGTVTGTGTVRDNAQSRLFLSPQLLYVSHKSYSPSMFLLDLYTKHDKPIVFSTGNSSSIIPLY